MLERGNGACPICRVKPIGRSLYSELPPVPGRQPTFESVEVALNRLVKALATPDNEMEQQEAAFALCTRAQEEDGFEELIAAGVLGPLMSIITAHSDSSSSVPVAACSCACVTLGLIAPQSSEQVIAAGGVPVLLSALKHASMAEYAALALSGLAENNASATAAAIAATDGGYAPLVALLDDGAVAVEAVDAACGALANLVHIDGAHGAAAAVEPAMARLRVLAAATDGGGGDELQQTAASLLSNVEMALLRLRSGSKAEAQAPAATAPVATAPVHRRVPRHGLKANNCVVM